MEALIWIFVIALIGGGIYFFVYIISKSAKTMERQGKNKERLGATMNSTMKHISGLPIGNGIFTEVYYCPEKIVFKASGQEITLSKEKISSIDITSGSNIGNTAAGAVAGKYIVGGTTGAAIGAIAATKIYCIISYTKENETKFVVLDTGASGTFANKMKKDFEQSSERRISNIEL